MTERKLTLSGGPLPYAVTLDGQDLSNGIRRLAIVVEPGNWPRVEAELAIHAVEIAELGVKDPQFVVSMPDEARAALIALGWTPPTEDDEPGQVEPEPEEIGVYTERAHLIAYLALHYRAVIAYNDPAEPDWPVIYIETPQGQLSWHLAADDLPLFPHVPVAGPGDAMPEWDGHDTPEKYRRLQVLVRATAEGLGLI